MVKGLIPLLRPASPAMPAEVAGVRPYFGKTGPSLTKGLIQKLNKREKSQPREWPRHCQHRWHAAWGATWWNPRRRTGGPSRHEASLFPQQGRRPRALLCFGAKLSLPTASYGIFRGGCRTPSKTPPGFTLHRGPTRSGSRGCKTVSLSHLWLLIFPSLCPPDYLRDLTPPPDITRAHPVVFQPADFSPSCCSPGSLDYSHEITPPLGTNLKRKRFSAFFRN